MDSRKPPEYTLDLSADRSSVKEVVKGILHTIFFHRFFTPLHPATHDVIDLTLPYVSEDDIEALVETRTNSLLRQLDSSGSAQTSPQYPAKTGSGRGVLVLQFLEKKRKKGWFVAKADEETVWETWIIDISLTSARSEPEAARNRQKMGVQLQEAAIKVVTMVNQERNHIPPITTNESNPFPYQILVNPRSDGWGQRLGLA